MVSRAFREPFDATLRVRCDGSDLTRWSNLAEAYDESLSAMVRRLLDQVPHRPRRSLPSVNPRLLREVACVGNNMNQIARAINAANVAGARTCGADILTELAIIERQLSKLLIIAGR